MIILGIDPGNSTGIAVIDNSNKSPRLLHHSTFNGGFTKRHALMRQIFKVADTAFSACTHSGLPQRILIQNPWGNGTSKVPLFAKKGKRSPVSFAKNMGLSCYILGQCEKRAGEHGLERIISIRPEDCSGMKMSIAVFVSIFMDEFGDRLDPKEFKTKQGNVRQDELDAANIARSTV